MTGGVPLRIVAAAGIVQLDDAALGLHQRNSSMIIDPL